jgi:hypothetical protein
MTANDEEDLHSPFELGNRRRKKRKENFAIVLCIQHFSLFRCSAL